MRKKFSAESLNWDAHYVGIKAMRERQQNSITLDELVKEALRLLSPFVHITIEDQIPVFTEWVESNLSAPIKSQRKNSWYRPKNY
jgi:hypothetical protein